jgi:hypothetical protein
MEKYILDKVHTILVGISEVVAHFQYCLEDIPMFQKWA